MPAALTLEAGMLLRPAPDRLLIGDRGAPAVDRQIVAGAQAVDRDLPMKVAPAPPPPFLGIGILLEFEGGVFLDQLSDCAGALVVVLAPLRGDRETVNPLRTFPRP